MYLQRAAGCCAACNYFLPLVTLFSTLLLYFKAAITFLNVLVATISDMSTDPSNDLIFHKFLNYSNKIHVTIELHSQKRTSYFHRYYRIIDCFETFRFNISYDFTICCIFRAFYGSSVAKAEDIQRARDATTKSDDCWLLSVFGSLAC